MNKRLINGKISRLAIALGVGASLLLGSCKPTPVPTIPDTSTIQKIAYTSNADGDDETFFMNTDGTSNSPFAFGDRFMGPKYNATNDELAITGQIDGNFDAYIFNRETGTKEIFANGSAYEGNLEISPNGNWGVFISTRDGERSLYVKDRNKTMSPIRLSSGAFDNNPTWSPDGKKLMFDRLANGETLKSIYMITFSEAYNFDSYTISKFSKNDSVDNITPVFLDDNIAAYSSDGNLIEHDIFTDDIDYVTNTSDFDIYPRPSPDKSGYTFTRGSWGDGDICTVKRNDSDLENLTNSPGVDDYASDWFSYTE